MKNWLGHEIEIGAVVFRGGRQGDTSSFRVGVVDDINEEKKNARVVWHYVPGSVTIWDADRYQYPHQDDNAYRIDSPRKASTQRTRYNINDLVRIENDQIERLRFLHGLGETARKMNIREENFEQFKKDYLRGLIPSTS